MSSNRHRLTTNKAASSADHSLSNPFRLSPIAAFVAGLAIIATAPVHAADDKAVSELQAEVVRLRKALEQSQQELARQKGCASIPVQQGVASSPQGSSAPAAASAGGSAASTTLDAVVISSKAQRNPLVELKEVPKSVSVVSGEELEKLNALNVSDIFKRIGNVRWNYGNPKTGSMSIRGISSGSSENIDPSLGVTVDNVPYAYVALASGSDYIDLETVDVSRGPQGFDGGRATTTGAINIKTRRPTFNPEASGSITFGEYNSLQTQGAIGGPVVDGLLAWRGTFYRNQAEGEFRNAYRDTENRGKYGNSDRTFGRVQLLLTPSADFEALVSLDYKPKGIEYVNGLTIRNDYPVPYYANGTAYNAVTQNAVKAKLARSYFTRGGYGYSDYLNEPTNEDNNKGILNGNKGFTANLTWKLPSHTLVSTTAYRNNFFQAGNDEGTPFDVTKDGGLFVHYDQVSQEFKLASNPGGEFDYVTGLFLGHTSSDASSRSRYGADSGAWFANNTQYLGLDANAGGRLLLIDSTNRLRKETLTLTSNNTTAVYGKTDWHLDALTGLPLTLGAGARYSYENRRTSQGNLITDEGYGAALNAVSEGGFNSNATTGALASNSAAQTALANAVASRYFGVATYAGLSAAQQQQVAYAKAVRAGQRGTYSAVSAATPYKDGLLTGVLSLTYKVDEQLSLYGTYQRGGKPGISQKVSTTNAAANVKEETTNAFEVGFRSSLLDNTLTLNGDIYQQSLDNFQTSISVWDPIQAVATPSNPYISLTGNLPQVTIKGLELDANYTGIEHFTFRLAGAYNDARYSKSVFLAGPEENGYLAANVFDANGKTLPNAPKFSYNLSGEYRTPVYDNQELHVNGNWNWQSKSNSTVGLSQYSWGDAYGVLDLGIGIGRRDKSYDVTLLIKNALDTNYKTSLTATSYVPSTSRWIGLMFSGKL